MPRGRKKALTPEEQLEKLVSEIEETENKLKELKAKRKELEEAIKMNRVVELEEFISSRGLSIDEVKELLEKKWLQMIIRDAVVLLYI